jgi:TM2 domain-containing membrane protein YozV
MALCANCGFEQGAGSYCPNCGSRSAPSSGTVPPPPGQMQQAPTYGQQQYSQPMGGSFAPKPSKDKVTAALLAIFLGGFGVHKFYLGGGKQKTAGIIQLVLSLFTCGVATIIPFIEGILYLTKDDQQFQAEYVYGGKDWF